MGRAGGDPIRRPKKKEKPCLPPECNERAYSFFLFAFGEETFAIFPTLRPQLLPSHYFGSFTPSGIYLCSVKWCSFGASPFPLWGAGCSSNREPPLIVTNSGLSATKPRLGAVAPSFNPLFLSSSECVGAYPSELVAVIARSFSPSLLLRARVLFFLLALTFCTRSALPISEGVVSSPATQEDAFFFISPFFVP